MKTRLFTLTLALAGVLFMAEAKDVKRETVKVPAADVTKAYPEKTIDLKKEANIEYVKLTTPVDEVVGFIRFLAINDKMIAIADLQQDCVFVFDRQGKHIRTIKRKGGGPEEYAKVSSCCIDLDGDRIYVWDKFRSDGSARIMVYNLKGDFVKELTTTGKYMWPEQLYNYDKNSLIAYVQPLTDQMDSPEYQYRLIDKNTGKMTHINLKVDKPLSNKVSVREGDNIITSVVSTLPMIKSGGNTVISDFATEKSIITENGKLRPLILRKNAGEKGNRRVLSSINAMTDNYLFIGTVPIDVDLKTAGMEIDEENCQDLVYDRRNNNIYTARIVGRDIDRDDNELSIYDMDLPVNTIVEPLYGSVLERLNEKGMLSGELKDIVADYDTEGNPILQIITFK